MSVTVDPIWLLAWLLVFVRALAWLVVVPPFSGRRVVPTPVLIGVAGGLAFLGVSHVPRSAVPTDTAGLLGSLTMQVFTGILLGFTVQVLVSAVTAAGAYVDMFGGLNLPPSIDPLSESQVPLIGQFYEQVAIVLLFVSGGEMLLVKGFVASLGHRGLTLNDSNFVAKLFTSDLATYFVASLEIAAPLIAVLFATQVALGMLSKVAPQLNVWILGFPLQILVSLLLVAVSIRVVPGYLSHIISRIGEDWNALMNSHP